MYEVAKHHKVLAAALEEVDTGTWPRLIVTMPPRHGKTQQISKFFPAWFTGRDPYRSTIIATYNDDYAGDIGRDVRDVLRHPRHQDIFPLCKLKIGAQGSDRIKTATNGQLSFVGRGIELHRSRRPSTHRGRFNQGRRRSRLADHARENLELVCEGVPDPPDARRLLRRARDDAME